MNNDFKIFLTNERKAKLNHAWQYLQPHQQMWLFLRAMWWSLPTFHQIVARLRNHFDVRITYVIYKAHWL